MPRSTFVSGGRPADAYGRKGAQDGATSASQLGHERVAASATAARPLKHKSLVKGSMQSRQARSPALCSLPAGTTGWAGCAELATSVTAMLTCFFLTHSKSPWSRFQAPKAAPRDCPPATVGTQQQVEARARCGQPWQSRAANGSPSTAHQSAECSPYSSHQCSRQQMLGRIFRQESSYCSLL